MTSCLYNRKHLRCFCFAFITQEHVQACLDLKIHFVGFILSVSHLYFQGTDILLLFEV